MSATKFTFLLAGTLLTGCESDNGDKDTSDEPSANNSIDTDEAENTEDPDPEETQPPEDSIDSEDESTCSLKELTSSTHQLPTSREDAAQVTLIPGEGESYVFSKETDEAWFVLDVPSWMCDVQFYTEEGVSIELEYTPDWDLGDVAVPVAECEDGDLYRHSWTFHAWGSYIVRVNAQQANEFWLASVLVL